MDDILGNVKASFFFIPLMSYFGLVAPKNIEGTIFALLTSVLNLSITVIQPLIGNLINNHVLVYSLNKNDLTGMWQIAILGIISVMLTFPILHLIPLKSQIEEWQKEERI